MIANNIRNQRVDKPNYKNNNNKRKTRKKKNKHIDLFSKLPPEVLGEIIKYSNATNILKSVNRQFRSIISYLKIESNSGWSNVTNKNKYFKFLSKTYAPIEIEVASKSDLFYHHWIKTRERSIKYSLRKIVTDDHLKIFCESYTRLYLRCTDQYYQTLDQKKSNRICTCYVTTYL